MPLANLAAMSNPSRSSGRFTPKGKAADKAAKAAGTGEGAAKGGAKGSGRYTAPVPKEISNPETAPWVIPVMFGSLGLGLLMIILNYMELLPGSSNNWYLLGGLALITCGFGTSTQLR